MAATLRSLIGALGIALVGAFAPAAEIPAEATGAYREAFGPPPKVEAGRCTAAVVFLPGAGASGDARRLGPLPLFSVDPAKVFEQAARVVVEGYPTPVRYFEPPRAFPGGSKLLQVEVRDRTAAVRVSVPGGAAVDPLAEQAVAQTLTQFEGIDAVSLSTADGASVSVRPVPSLREPPPPPRLLDVVSSVHPGEEPDEIDVLFDRPLEVKSFSIRLRDGTGIPGRTYTSMFDMAVVFRPEDPKILREGLPLSLRWTVGDRTGRMGEGEEDLGLRIYRHPE